MIISILKIFALICTAVIGGKLSTKLKLPAILGWLVAGIIFGPYLAGVVTSDITDAMWYKVAIKFFEAIAGIMIGREIILKKLASSGKQIIGITVIQSIGTFLFVSLIFAIVLAISGLPVYLAFIFGGIALATAPAPALSIVNEYHTHGPVTNTLIPLAAIDDVIGVIVFFTVISIVEGAGGVAHTSIVSVIGIVIVPFIIGIINGIIASWLINRFKHKYSCFFIFVSFLILSAVSGLLIDLKVFHSFSLNDLLIGMAYSATVVNFIPKDKTENILSLYNPLLNLSLVVVIANLGMPLDYRLIAGAGVFTATYIISRAAGKIGGAYLGGKITKAQPAVTKYLGLTLLPHSGVSLVFTGIAVTTLNRVDPSLSAVISGTIVAAAIINEIIAVLIAKYAFKWAGEIS
ncbi:MAG: cation:proton antiporter [Firmicutes bacterium]|nr:cation:proton antiporter [Bacillota bacterium]